MNRKTIYNSHHLRVYEDVAKLPDGTTVDDYSIVELNDVVAVVATNESNQLIMLQEYRYAINKTLWNIPAGTFKRGAEEPASVAARELLEEAGCAGDAPQLVTKLYEYPTKATHNVYVYRIANARKVANPRHEVTEHLRIKLIKLEEAKNMVFAGEIEAASVISAIVLALPDLFGKK